MQFVAEGIEQIELPNLLNSNSHCRNVEDLRTGVPSIPLATPAAGAEMKAHFAMFFKLRDGKIAS